MTYLAQNHYGNGDNVARDKIINVIKSIAPSDLDAPMELVFESLRRKDKATAKTQIVMLKVIAQRDPQSAALVEALSIYGGLVEADKQDSSWGIVARIISGATDPVIRDVCLAALFKLSYRTEREAEVKALYFAEISPGTYSQEAYLRYYADLEQLQETVKGFPTEGVLTGAVEGALRLDAGNFAFDLAKRLNSIYSSYNAKVLLAIAKGILLNPDLAKNHFWLSRPGVKERVDEVRDIAIRLLDEIGTDDRVHDLCCSLLNIYNFRSSEMLEALERHAQHLDPSSSEIIAKCMVFLGDDNFLSQAQRDLKVVASDPIKRLEFCQNFLNTAPHRVEDLEPFIKLANSSQIGEWLSRDEILVDASEIEQAYIKLVADIFRCTALEGDKRYLHDLVNRIEKFSTEWGDFFNLISPNGLFDIAEKLIALKLPHMAVKLVNKVVPKHELWHSPYVLIYLRCLLEAGQDKTFQEVISRVKGGEKFPEILSLQSIHAERLGHTELAIKHAESIIEIEPLNSYGWYRKSYLLIRYKAFEEQKIFQENIPDSVLEKPSREVKAIHSFLALTGGLKRAEIQWVKWMIEDPRRHAVDLVNFNLGLILRKNEGMPLYEESVAGCLAGIEYVHEGETLIRLIVDDEIDGGEFALKSSSPVAKLLMKLEPGESEILNMASFKVVQKLTPYVACVRIALKLRHLHNDGTDAFVMMSVPSDPSKLISFLEEKFVKGNDREDYLKSNEAIPLYMRGHALNSLEPFKAAINCWTDRRTPKPPLCDVGVSEPTAVVLDAYSISYLAVTNLVGYFKRAGISLVLPQTTREMLELFLSEISDDGFMLLGINDEGRLYRTTATDLRERDGHILANLRLILDSADVVAPVMHDEELDIFTLKDGVDSTVYSAIQLSIANDIPWLCMDTSFGGLHNSKGYLLFNVQDFLLKEMAKYPFDFNERRHSLLLYAIGSLSIPVTLRDLYELARVESNLAGFILFKIISLHGREIFSVEGRSGILLNLIYLHLVSLFGRERMAINASYEPAVSYTSHIFNHGLALYMDLSIKNTAEFRLAAAIYHMSQLILNDESFFRSMVKMFFDFARGHFMNFEAIKKNYILIESMQSK